jgi:DNA polymerase III delta subunit
VNTHLIFSAFHVAVVKAILAFMSTTRLYLISGDDEYLLTEKAHAIVKQNADAQLERIDGAVDKVDPAVGVIRQCLSSINSLGLFSEQRLIWLENALFLGDNRASQSTAVQDELSRLTDKIKAGLPDDVTLLITAPSVDKRRAFYKACKAAGELHEFKIPDDRNYRDQASVAERLETICI